MLYDFQLVLDQHTHGVGKFIQRLDAGKIPAVDHFCRRDILVVAGKDTDNGNAVRPGTAHLQGGVHKAGLVFIGSNLAAVPGADLHHVVGLHVRENNEHLMFVAGLVDQVVGGPDGKAIPVAAVGDKIKYPVIFIL